MKIRNDYVSNSSSSSFLINLEKPADEYSVEEFLKLFKQEPEDYLAKNFEYYVKDILDDLKYTEHFEIPHYPFLYYINYHDNSDPEKFSIMHSEYDVNHNLVIAKKWN